MNDPILSNVEQPNRQSGDTGSRWGVQMFIMFSEYKADEQSLFNIYISDLATQELHEVFTKVLP